MTETNATPPALKSDWRAHSVSETLARLWLAHGGDHHGPRVEHVTMPMANFTDFAEALLASRAEGIAALREALERAEGWFRDYERQHRAKNTSDADAKADVNFMRAEACRAARALTPGEGGNG